MTRSLAEGATRYTNELACLLTTAQCQSTVNHGNVRIVVVRSNRRTLAQSLTLIGILREIRTVETDEYCSFQQASKRVQKLEVRSTLEKDLDVIAHRDR